MTSAPYTQTIEQCFADRIGGKGLSRAAYAKTLAACSPALDRLRQWQKDGSLPLLRLPHARADLAEPRRHAERLRQNFANVVILGTGGSSLGGQTLVALADLGFGPRPNTPKLWFMDNVDPATFSEMFARLDPDATAVVAISKSGSTAETLTQLLATIDWFTAHFGENTVHEHIVAVTEPRDNVLRRLAARHRIPTLDHDPKVGGRFSVLSLVGLIPAMVAGLDVEKIREGAADVLDETLAAREPALSAPAVGAALSMALAQEQGLHNTVLMPYVDRLGYFGLWFRQLWAESLGKGGKGTTPIRAMGTVDQHSQVQLYLDGPADKMFTVVLTGTQGQGARIDAHAIGPEQELGYLSGRTIGDLMEAEARATIEAIARNGRPVRVLDVPKIDECSMGALLMHYMLETIIAAQLLGVDAFDQPAVEQGKVLTREFLGNMKSS
jgi:glucose-6-phosphate isomerase